MNLSSNFRIHPDGWRFVGIFAALTLIGYYTWHLLFLIFCVLTAWCFYFFRNPVRHTPMRKGLVVAPADGIIVAIKPSTLPAELERDDTTYTRISIFLNVFDVHVNKIPVEGHVRQIVYIPGRFFNASLDKASEFNERNTLAIESSFGLIAVTQIAGLIARRIRCDVIKDDPVIVGENFGLIRFGSRVDLYLPTHLNVLVTEGQRMIGGETVIADFLRAETDTPYFPS